MLFYSILFVVSNKKIRNEQFMSMKMKKLNSFLFALTGLESRFLLVLLSKKC